MLSVLSLLKELIAIPSITPNDGGCQTIIADYLLQAGFQCQSLPFGEVDNLWAVHGSGYPCLAFAGHTDVVPPGDEKKWNTPPFVPTEQSGYLYGRGAADMKSGLAAMVVAALQFVNAYPHHAGSIAFIITSDEEGPADNGTKRVVEYLQSIEQLPTYCVVGEASSNQQLGDAIKIGRRGSMHGDLTIFGRQGHIAYPHLANNPIHRCLLAIDELAKTKWDEGNKYFVPTAFQSYAIAADAGAANIIPGDLSLKFNFRFSPTSTPHDLQEKVKAILDKNNLAYDLRCSVSSEPFFSGEGKLAKACMRAIKETLNIDCVPNTYGGTSDGRFIAKAGTEVIEFGPINATAHHVNEQVLISDLNKLSQVYYLMISSLLGSAVTSR